MPVPLPNPVIRASFLLETDADMVLSDGDSLAGIRFEFFDFAAENCADDFFLEPGFFLSKLRFGGGRGFIIFRIVIGVGEVEEQIGEE